MKILKETKVVEVVFPSGNVRTIETDLNTGEFTIKLVGEPEHVWNVLKLRNHASELMQIATLVKDQLNQVKGYEFNEEVEVKQEPSEEEKLRAVYFGFYDQMDEPERIFARANWDYKFAKLFYLPESINDAICNGFNWEGTNQTRKYWLKLSGEKYGKK